MAGIGGVCSFVFMVAANTKPALLVPALVGGFFGTMLAPFAVALIPYGISALIRRKMSTQTFMTVYSVVFGLLVLMRLVVVIALHEA